MIVEIEWPETTKENRPVQKSQRNIRAFLDARGVELRRDAFALRDEVVRDGRTVLLDDAVLRSIRLEADNAGLSPRRDYFDDVISDLARKNSFHPVLNYIEHLQWDGVKRVDTFFQKYAGAPDLPLIKAMGRAMLVAAVRRVRQPGSKFDTIIVLEGPQGVGKSTFVKELAGDAWFSDSLQIGTDPKATIEQTAGKWICEFGELSGHRKKEQQTVKAFLSRSVDSAALKYERRATDVPRQFICIATVNDQKYLTDMTGNRRYWCVPITTVNVAALRADRDQIWAEAARIEEDGASVVLPKHLVEVARLEQQKRCLSDPWLDELEPLLEDECGAVAKSDLWQHLKIEAKIRDRYTAERVEQVMLQLGFEGRRLRGHSRFPGKAVHCFVKDGWGTAPMPWLLNPEEPVRYHHSTANVAAPTNADLWR